MVNLDGLRKQIADRRELPTPGVCRALRQASGLSAADVARALGLTRQAVTAWERGERRPSAVNCDGYLRVLRMLEILQDDR